MKLLTKIDKPWGFEKIWAFSDRVDGYVGKIIHINEGHRLSLQKHGKKEETILVLNGELEVVLSNGVLFLSVNDTFHIMPRFNSINSFILKRFVSDSNFTRP